MGSSTYDPTTYTRRVTDAHERGADLFTHTADIRQGRVASGVHEKLNPASLNRLGRNVRESRDSEAHPVSNAVAVMFDVTGSMAGVPRTFIEKLDKLMGLLVRKTYLPDPQILFGAVGDVKSDRSPLQVGQFESGNEMDEALSLIHLEAGGGPANTESYELALYYLARHAEMDCLEKRSKKGYLFMMGDELPYSHVSRDEVHRITGDEIEANIPLETILEEVRRKFELFWVMPGGTAHWGDRVVLDPLAAMFGQNLLRMEDPGDVCEFIASTVGLCEGRDIHAVTADLGEVGADAASVSRVGAALAGYRRRFDLTA